jgi:hypothetical protein
VLEKKGFLTELGVKYLVENSPRLEANEHVVDQMLIFRIRTQRTRLAVTNKRLYCILDSEKTAAAGRRIQWSLRLHEIKPIKARPKVFGKKNSGLVSIGPKHNWLYSLRLHPQSDALEKQIQELVDRGWRG